jgi:hypothetical protein
MRLILAVAAGVMACLVGISLAAADPPSDTQTSTPTPSSAAAPAAASAAANASTPAAEAAKPAVIVQGTAEMDALEKHFLAEGYKAEMHNGEKVFCRREEPQVGSRLGAPKVCGTAQQLQSTEREAQAAFQRGQSQQNNPSGK